MIQLATPAYDFPSSVGYLDVTRRIELSDRLLELETILFDPSVRRNINSVADLLTDDFREFGSSGRTYTKLDILAELSTEQPALITISDFTCDLIAPSVALVTYKSLSNFDSRPGSQALRSSIWVLKVPEHRYGHVGPREGVWRMQFHQGTRF